MEGVEGNVKKAVQFATLCDSVLSILPVTSVFGLKLRSDMLNETPGPVLYFGDSESKGYTFYP